MGVNADYHGIPWQSWQSDRLQSQRYSWLHSPPCVVTKIIPFVTFSAYGATSYPWLHLLPGVYVACVYMTSECNCLPFGGELSILSYGYLCGTHVPHYHMTISPHSIPIQINYRNMHQLIYLSLILILSNYTIILILLSNF